MMGSALNKIFEAELTYSRRIITTHPERTLEESKYCSECCTKSCEILEVVKNEAGGLLVVVAGKHDADDNDKG